VAIGASPVIVVAMYYYVYRVKEFSRAERQSEGALASVAHEALGTVRLTRAFNQEARAQGRFTRESAASLESGFAAGLREQRAAWVIDVLTAVATAGVVWFGVHQVQSGAITSGTLIVFVSYTSSFYRPVRAVMKQSHKIVKATAQLERVVELLDIDEFVTDHPEATRAPAFAGEIELRQVSFSYEPGRPVLHDLDLRFPARRLTAVVGPTGSGKTTLLSLIPRLYDPTAGAVLIDGHDIRRYTLQSLRSQISVVLQETVLLRASIAENIAYGMPSASQEQIEQAARAANAHDFIVEQPHGYQTEVGERGDTLSGGQRQRIAIARAILRNTPILLFDEPLTGLDAGSASLVMDALEGLIRGRTAIVVTHQGVLAERADHVVVVQSGRVVKEEEREVPRAQERGRLVMPVSGHLVDRGRHR
jgi:ABC-type multidrug transport system fused ATPase/permease subunit